MVVDPSRCTTVAIGIIWMLRFALLSTLSLIVDVRKKNFATPLYRCLISSDSQWRLSQYPGVVEAIIIVHGLNRL